MRREPHLLRGRAAAWATLVALPLCAGAVAATASPAVPGASPVTYRLHGNARVTAAPVIDREVEVHADAEVTPGAAPGALAIRVGAEGHACTLTARAEAGALAFEAGQRCPIDLHDPDARGHVDATLRSGRGRIGGDELALDLAFDLQGAVSVRTARHVEVMGKGVDLPAVWMPAVPVHGSAEASAEGSADHARAAGP